jgi:DNA repair exonuclease SbcCD ATPase subunit
VATLEDAAEQLVVKLRGLDSEIEESQHALEELRERVGAASKEVDEEWASLAEAVSTLMDRLREERESLAGETREATQAAADAAQAVHGRGAEARSEIAGGEADLEALAQHATGLQPGVESLVTDGGEAPANHLAERARAIDEQLTAALQEACAFLRDEVAAALGELASQVGEHCQGLRERLSEIATVRLPELFDEWESSVDELEEYVAASGFEASHGHAHAVVEWALTECATHCEEQLAAFDEQVAEATQPLQELARALTGAVESLAAEGAGLKGRLSAAHESAARTVPRLDSVRALLASFSFVSA